MATTEEGHTYTSAKPRDPSEIPLRPFHDVFFEDMEKLLETNGDYECLELVDAGKKFVVSEFLSMPRRIASALTRRGFQKGDVLCTFINNHLEYLMVSLAVWKCGGCMTMMVPSDTPGDVAAQLEDCKSKWLLVDTDTITKAKEALSRLPGILSNWKDHLFIVGGEDSIPELNPAAVTVDDLLNDSGDSCPLNVDIDVMNDVVFLPYSSGTTGLPKGVMHTHYSLIASYWQTKIGPSPPLPPGTLKRLLATVGMYHVTGTLTPFIFIPKGYSVGLFKKSEETDEKILQYICKYKPQFLFILPQQMVQLAGDIDISRYDTSSLKAISTGGAHISSKYMEAVKQKFKVQAVTNYGSTETMGILSVPITPLGPPSLQGNYGNNIGSLRAYSQAKIVDQKTKVALGPLEEGEIVLRSPAIAKGYLNRPQETDESFVDGWYYTGDLGYFDDKGNLYFVDRLKEILKYKNIQVAPAQLECILTQHHDVKDAVVIGVPDPQHGDLPRAYVALRQGAQITEDEIRNLVDCRVADYKHLRGGVRIIDSIPRNSYGKPMRRKLLQMAKEELKAKP